MTFEHLDTVVNEATAVFGAALPMEPLPDGAYASMRYPALLPVMRFSTKRYAAEPFGNVFSMYTKAMGGLMQLATLTFTPNLGTDVPLLLVDVMAFGKKRAVFVEYYDLTAKGAVCPALEAVAATYTALPDYPEKPAWYVKERTPYSLIKGGTDDTALLSMLTDSVAAYAALCREQTAQRPENLEKLAQFASRMVTEGNPSSATMEKVLGKDGANAFFARAVMPATFTKETI